MAKNKKSSFWDQPRKVFAFSYNDMDWIPNAIKSTYDEAEFVVMPGGSDWNPALYGQLKGKQTGFYPAIDIEQLTIFIKAVLDRKFIIGICRGAQLCCIGAGGSLMQHVSNHCGYQHEIYTQSGEVLFTNSIHHQMCHLPTIVNFKECVDLVAYAKNLSNTYLDGFDREYVTTNLQPYNLIAIKEPEMVYYHKIRAFGIQGHPEGYSMPDATNAFILDQIAKYYEASEVNAWSGYSQILSRLFLFYRVYPELKDRLGIATIKRFRATFMPQETIEVSETANIVDITPTEIPSSENTETVTQIIKTENKKNYEPKTHRPVVSSVTRQLD